MKSTLLFVVIVYCFSLQVKAQQMPLFSQYREYYGLLNPAMPHTDYIGLDYRPSQAIGISYRKQWTGIQDAPKTFTVHYEYISKPLKSLFGTAFIKDDTSPTSLTGAYLRYAYKINFGRYANLWFGVSASVLQYSYQHQKGELRDAGDIIGLTNTNNLYSDFSFGTFYQAQTQNDHRFYTGLSILQLANIFYTPKEASSPNRVPHFYFLIGIYKYLSDGFGSWEGSMYLEPSVWIKYAPAAPIQTDMNIRWHLPASFWIGAGYSFSLSNYQEFDENFSSTNLNFEAGISLELGNNQQLKFGYSYARTIHLYTRLGNIHELNINYTW